MSVGQTQQRAGTAYRKSRSAGGLTKLLAMTGHAMSLRARSALIWGVVLGALGALFAALWPTFSGNGAGYQEMIKSMPESAKGLVGFEGARSAL